MGQMGSTNGSTCEHDFYDVCFDGVSNAYIRKQCNATAENLQGATQYMHMRKVDNQAHGETRFEDLYAANDGIC